MPIRQFLGNYIFGRGWQWKQKRKCGKSVSFELELSEESYMQIEKMIHQMEQDSSQYHYSRLGVFLYILHIPFKMRQRYFCSQFVMEMLSLTGSVSLRKKPCLYLPNHLPEELQRQKCLMQVNYNPIWNKINNFWTKIKHCWNIHYIQSDCQRGWRGETHEENDIRHSIISGNCRNYNYCSLYAKGEILGRRKNVKEKDTFNYGFVSCLYAGRMFRTGIAFTKKD